MTAKDRLTEIQSLFDKGEIDGFKGADKKTYKLFYSFNGILCYYINRSCKKGLKLEQADAKNFDSYIYHDSDIVAKDTYRVIDKYRKHALKNLYTNPWIEKCLALPNTFERWKKEGKKSLLDLGVTLGDDNDGEIITVGLLKRINPTLADEFFHYYENDMQYASGSFPFKTRIGRFFVDIDQSGHVMGRLEISENGTDKGKTYFLINNDNFIFYSK